jgi:SAM-dependent methyltransferase
LSGPPTPFDNRRYWESRLGGEFSLAGVGYLRLGRRFNEWMYRVRGEVFDRVVEELESGQKSTVNGQRGDPTQPWAGREILDVGSGTGFYVDRWLRLGARVTGLDLTEVAVARLTGAFPGAHFLRGDIGGALDEVPLEPGSFDAASAFDVLFHIVDDAQYARAFRNIAALLRPGGWFLWSDNFLRHGEIRVRHQASRPLAESVRLAEAAGFEVVDRRPMFVLMNYPADTTSRLLRWAWTAMVAPAALGEPIGWALGAALYPLERALVRRMRESPSTELMVCRRRG